MVWLHGWGQDKQSFSRIASLFKKAGPHTLYDFPGFGDTPMLDDGAGTREYAAALKDQLDTIGKGPFIIIGHSFGGRVAIQMAAHYPDLIKAIVLIGGAGLKRKRSLIFKCRALILRCLGKLAKRCDTLFSTNLRALYAQRFGSADYKAAGDLRATFVNVVNEDLVSEASMVKCPALMLYGEMDTEAPPEIGKKYACLIKNGTYTELQGFGHLDILHNGAYQCHAIIDDFIKELDS